MERKVKIIDPSSDQRWDVFISKHEHGSLYHTSEWKDLVQRSYGYQPYYYVLEDSARQIRAAIPFFLVNHMFSKKKLVCLPFADYANPLSLNEEDMEFLFSAILEQKRGFQVPVIEINIKGDLELLERYLCFKKIVSKTHILPLSPPLQEIRKGFHKSTVERGIRKAMRSNITLVRAASMTDMRSMYDLYVTTRRNHGLPPQPFTFFKNLWNLFKPKNMVSVLLAFYGKIPIAGILLMNYKDVVYYLYGGSERGHLDKRPYHLLLWKTIETAYEEGFKFLDLGRTSLNNLGLMEFKRRWGAGEQNITSYANHDKTGIKKSIWMNTHPIRNQAIMRINRKLPKFILRSFGNLFYKYFE